MRPLLSLAIAGLVTFVPAPGGAQSVLDASARLAPQYMTYDIGSPVDIRVSQLAMPVAIVLPIARGMTIDIGTAWASAEVRGGVERSTISGLTDTQLRASWTLGSDAVVITAGMNLPTGRSTVTESQIDAAGLIGNDFLAFPISNMGTGFGGTGGVAVARPLGEWNVGIGGSLRYSGRYEPFEIGGQRVQYEPGSEYRLRAGADRPMLGGRLSLGATLSMFGDDAAGGTTYSSGNRYILQGAWLGTLRGIDVSMAGWNLTRGAGETVGGEAPWENIANLAVAATLDAFGTAIEPSVEIRTWMRDAGERASGLHRGDNIGRMVSVGVRTEGSVLGIMLMPSVGYSLGGVQAGSGRADITGWRVVVGARWP